MAKIVKKSKYISAAKFPEFSKSMKGKIAALLGFLLLAAPAAVQAQYGYSTNGDGSIYTYSTNADGSASIDAYAGPPWDVTIPTNINTLLVTSIGSEAFESSTNLTSVTLSGSVTSIGAFAFDGCSNLASVTLSNALASIGDEAFYGCFSLTNAIIPCTTTNIGDEAFAHTGLTSVTIPGAVTGFGGGAFLSCTSLTNATILPGVTSIGSYAFFSCPSLTNVTMPRSLTNIEDYAFYYCTNLSSVYITGNPPAFGSNVFSFDNSATVYHMPGTAGWSNTFDGVPTVLWNLLIQASGAGFGVQSNQFGFNITNPANINFTVVVEVCTNLAGPVWFPLQTVTLTNGSFYFSEPLQVNSSSRFYGLGLPYAQCGGTLQVTITPPGAVSAGAEWQVDGGAWEFSGAMVKVSPGDHTVQFSNIAGWNMPSNQIVTITNGFETTAAANYTEDNSYPYDYTENSGTITITGYSGPGGSVTIPSAINGLPVAGIGPGAFESCSNLTSITIPVTVTKLGDRAFYGLTNLISAYFYGNAPRADSTVFFGDNKATVYYLPDTTGWVGYSGIINVGTVLWIPQVQNSGANFGVKTNEFGFNITWASGRVVVVEGCANLASGVWTPLQTGTLTNGLFYFSDPQWTNYPGRFYRVSAP